MSEDIEKATILNTYFISVLTEELDLLTSLPEVTDVGRRMVDLPPP